MYKIVIDEKFIRDQANDMAANIRHHTFEHIKLIIEEMFKTPLDDKQKRVVVDLFIEEFLKQTNREIGEIWEAAKKYLAERLKENREVLLDPEEV